MRSFILLSAVLSITSFSLVLAGPLGELNPRQTVCGDLTVIFARGTGESAPIGSLVGPQLKSALASALPGKNINFTGVTYAADIAGYLNHGDAKGSIEMARLLNNAAVNCPHTPLVTSGYR